MKAWSARGGLYQLPAALTLARGREEKERSQSEHGIENKIAKGVEILINDSKQIIHAGLEVIISCGSINSPQLLMLSGIGNAIELQQLGININYDLPGVGKNLQDHLEIYIQHKNTQPLSLYSLFNNPFVQFYEGIICPINVNG